MPIPALPMAPALEQRLAGHPFLLLLDVDGTLAPIAPQPSEAVVPDDTRQVLIDLAAMDATQVAIVSGRAAADARRMVGVDGLWVIGNHGIEVAPPNRTASVREDIVAFADRVGAAAERIAAFARELPGVIVEDKRWTASVHYRMADPSVRPALTAAVERAARAEGLEVKPARMNLELRPPIRIDKGTAAVELARELGALSNLASVLVAGDDLTDEDMFRALRDEQPSAVTVWVAHDAPERSTVAEFTVPGTDAFRQLLEAIVRRRRQG